MFKNNGKIWTKDAIEVFDHDFPSQASGVAIPYGIYDVLKNNGCIFIGTSHDTSEFAVNSISKWWRYIGRFEYSNAEELLILADTGGSNSAQNRAWKYYLQKKLCNIFNLKITVAHYPAGASKWNPIEHRLFSEISKNWRGRPFETYETILNFIKTTRTKTGLTVNSYLDNKNYYTGIKISDIEMNDLNIVSNDIVKKWNYTIFPN